MKRLRSAVGAMVVLAAAPVGVRGAPEQPGPCTQPAANCQLPDQMGHGASNALGAKSDANPASGFVARDNFLVATGGTISGLCWWGFYLDPATPADCGPGTVADAFTVTYYNNAVGIPPEPGPVRAGPFTISATLSKAPTGNFLVSPFGNLAEYGYSATHAPFSVGAGECLWVKVSNNTAGSNPPCLWFWSSAPSAAEGGIGDGLFWHNELDNDYDLAFCIDRALGDPASCALSINPGCEGATNPCSQESFLPGCADQECCSLVCEDLGFCCAVAWDEQCVATAADTCGQCGNPSAGDCTQPHLTPFCNDQCGGNPCIGCCQIVCAVDPFCCALPPFPEGSWDGICAYEATPPPMGAGYCSCPPGQAPPNDNCEGAIAIGLGVTPVNNTCGTAGPPNHPFCNDGFLTGLGVDVWYKYTAGYTGQLLVSTCDQVTFDSQIAVYDGCNCQSLGEPIGCNNDGAVCGSGTSLVVVSVVTGHCYTIRIGSSYVDPTGSGTLTLSDDIPQPCDIGPLPPGAIEEGEPCGQSTNGGCTNGGAPTFTPVQLGQTVHGTAWAALGMRDTDWYALVLPSPAEVTLSVEAEFSFIVGFAETTPGGSGDCADHDGDVSPSEVGTTCAEASLTELLGAGTWWPFVAPATFDGLPCPAGVTASNDYILSVTTGPPCPWDCADGDGQVAILDFLALLGGWGTPGATCDLGLGAPGPGIDEFLAILGHWGPCP